MWNITRGATFVCPVHCEQNDHVRAFLKRCDPDDLVRILSALDSGIDHCVEAARINNRISFTKTGIVVGERSVLPPEDVDFIWSTILRLLGDQDRTAIFTMGSLFKWRMALRTEEHWLMKIDETGSTDPLTGEPVKAAEYFLSDSFIPPVRRQKKAKPAPVDISTPVMTPMELAFHRAGLKVDQQRGV